jgi:hypothetical protein
MESNWKSNVENDRSIDDEIYGKKEIGKNINTLV